MELSTQAVKKIVREELPGLMKKDKRIRKFILDLSKEPWDELNEKTDRLEKQTESRFDILLEELRKDREEQNEKWREQNRKWDEQNKKWEENQKVLIGLHRKHENTLGALGARWGLRSESSFRNALKNILKDFDVTVLNTQEFDEKGEVFGRPEQIELDIVIINGKRMICELKSSMSRADMYTFYKKAKFYERIHQKESDRYIVISPMVEDRAKEVAKDLGITIYSYAEEMEGELAPKSTFNG